MFNDILIFKYNIKQNKVDIQKKLKDQKTIYSRENSLISSSTRLIEGSVVLMAFLSAFSEIALIEKIKKLPSVEKVEIDSSGFNSSSTLIDLHAILAFSGVLNSNLSVS